MFAGIFCFVLAEVIWLCIIYSDRKIFKLNLDFRDFFFIPGLFLVPMKEMFPEKYVHGDPFEAQIVTIDDGIKVYMDLDKAKNLEIANQVVVDTVIVQKTCRSDCLVEVVTGKILHQCFDGESEYCFGYYESYDESRKVSSSRLREYVEERARKEYKGHKSFKAYLDYMEKRAEKYYQIADSNTIFDNIEIRNILNGISNSR